MSEPTRHDFEQLAPPVDLDAAFAVFERRRRRRSTTRRLTFAGSIVVLVLAAVAAVIAGREHPDQQVATEPEGAVAEIGACEPTLAGEPYSFSDLFELGLAWVEADGIDAEPFPEYDEYVRDFYGRLGADEDLVASVSYQRVELVDSAVRRSGVADDVTYEGSGRVVAAHASTVESVRPGDTVVAVVSQSMAGATGDPQDVDFIETLAIVHPDGTVEFSGPCARQKYTEPLQRAAAAMSANEGSGVDSESDTLNRMINDPAFAEEALVAASQQPDEGTGTDAADRLVALMRSRFETYDGTWAVDNVAEALTLSDQVVVGRVVEAVPGTGWRLSEDPEDESGPNDGQSQVPFESADADWRTVRLLVEVEEQLRGGGDPDLLRVGVVLYPHEDRDAVMSGFGQLGPLVLFLDDGGPVFAAEDGVMAVLANGHLVATVNDDGVLDLPFVAPRLADQLLAATPTLDALRAAAEGNA